jgi:hypothetical protein
MTTPRNGTRGTYDTGNTRDEFTVIRVEGNLCWAAYDKHPGDPQPFIWRFREGLNKFHHWPGKEISA